MPRSALICTNAIVSEPSTIYQYNCWLADKDQIEAREAYMRSVIAKKKGGNAGRGKPSGSCSKRAWGR
jgi:hypothetical protein